MLKNLRGFVDNTEARLAPGNCTVQYKQLNMWTQSVEFCSAWSFFCGLKSESLGLIDGTF